ncbi:RNA recognition motif domain-containing protein [Thiohalophilus thiocyanatoxydans]|uniref:RNA recognition motif-containing protein n=1 Tax=Thiohalophilus thiocyanatoxydans TaxID=381308 RepID=A0A4R8ILI8_9GAMM|nr:RNA-binding protein [Thiohalophilus thiocyanatoxydans]TDY00984.1 RNA recognition motif-containing protein [Thiohalophilus thiocyanatoxydans]
MKFEFPTLKTIIQIILISLILAVVAYFAFPLFALEQVPAQRLFTYGILAGALLGMLLISTRIYPASSTRVESIFVGNLAFKASPNALRKLFEEYGDVHAVRLMTDRATRRPRGFGFVEMKRKDAKNAIRALDGTEFYGRELKVNVANERKSDD